MSGDLPDGWRTVALGDVLENVQPGFACGERDESGTIQLRLNNILPSGEMDWGKFIRIPDELVNADRYALNTGDLLFNHTNSAELVGKSAIFPGFSERVVFSNHFYRLKPARGLASAEFLASWLKKSWHDRLFDRICNRWIGQAGISRKMLLSLQLALPPLDEQHRIVAQLNTQLAAAGRARQAAQAQLDALDAMSAALLREIFPRSPSAPLRRGWRWVKLAEVCSINPRRPRNLGLAPSDLVTFIPMAAVSEEAAAITSPLLRPYSEVQRGYTYMQEGDVIFAKITPCMQNGKHSVVQDTHDGLAFGSTEFHVLRPFKTTDARFLHRFLLQPSFLREAQSHFRGAVGQQRLPKEFLSEHAFPLPPLSEQQSIVDTLETQATAVAQGCAATQAQLEAAKALPAALLRLAFPA